MDQPLDLRVKRSANDDRQVSNIIQPYPYPMALLSQFWRNRAIPEHPLKLCYWPNYQGCAPLKPRHVEYEQVDLNRPTTREVAGGNLPKFNFEHVGKNFDDDLDRKIPAPELTEQPRKCLRRSPFSIDAILSSDSSVDVETSSNYETNSTTKRASSIDSRESYDPNFDMPASFRATVPQCPNITIIIDGKRLNEFDFGDEHEYHLYLLAKKTPLHIVRLMEPDDAEAYMKFKQQYGGIAPRTKTNLNMRRKVQKSAHLNDPEYTMRRLKNNESAKRSRDNRIAMSYEMELLDMFLKQIIEVKSRRLQTIVQHRNQPILC